LVVDGADGGGCSEVEVVVVVELEEMKVVDGPATALVSLSASTDEEEDDGVNGWVKTDLGSLTMFARIATAAVYCQLSQDICVSTGV